MFESQFFHLSPATLSIIRASNEMDSTLLITGNTGTGKSHLASAVHHASKRGRTNRWFKINLATLSENLIESELFGHERGAFTGAETKRIGRLELCHGGSVFLDEIGELSPRLQAKLLDFIQYKKVTPVGSNRETYVDVRIIAATNRNLELAVKSGEFRSDLFHRLNVFHVKLPDLSLQPKSIPGFARIFLERIARVADKKMEGLSREAEIVIRNYPWPGNIRELENAIEYAVAMEESSRIKLKSLPKVLQEYAREHLKIEEISVELEEDPVNLQNHLKESMKIPPLPKNAVGFLELPLTYSFHECKESFEKAYLEQALRWCGGQINLTSRKIGLNKVSLAGKIRKFKIDWRRIRYESGLPGAMPIACAREKSEEPVCFKEDLEFPEDQ